MATVYNGAERQNPSIRRTAPHKQENICPQQPHEDLAMIATPVSNIFNSTSRPTQSLTRFHPGPVRPSPQQYPAKHNVRLTTGIPEISLHEFNPHIHQIVCHFGHVKPQQGCLPCRDLYEKLSAYIPIDPRIQQASSLQDARCPVYFKSPVGIVSQPALPAFPGQLNENRNPQNGLLHFHAREVPVKQTYPQRSQHNICITVNQPSNSANEPVRCISNQDVPDVNSGHKTLVTRHDGQDLVGEDPRPLREYTRTPSITISMRDPLSNGPYTAARNLTPIEVPDTCPDQSCVILEDDVFTSPNTSDIVPPPEVITAPKREKSKSLPMTPIKARKEARKPAWSTAETPNKRPISPSKKQQMTPKRIKALEGMVQELRDEFGNLKLHLEKQEQDRDMADLFFGD